MIEMDRTPPEWKFLWEITRAELDILMYSKAACVAGIESGSYWYFVTWFVYRFKYTWVRLQVVISIIINPYVYI